MTNPPYISTDEIPHASLWDAVSKLMKKHYGKENLNRLARDTGIGNGTATRIKERGTSVGLDTLIKIASFFRVEPWQLLVPGFDPESLPALTGASVMAQDVGKMIDGIKDEAQRRRAYGLILQVVDMSVAAAPPTDAGATAPSRESGQQATHAPLQRQYAHQEPSQD